MSRLLKKADQDDIFFMSGAIAFNLIVAVLPLLIFALGVAGFFFQARFADPGAQAIDTIRRLLPPGAVDGELLATMGRAVDSAIESRTRFSVIGSVLILFFSTRLAATLRSVLRVVFEVPKRRALVRGKLHDLQVVIVAGLLVLLDLTVIALGRGVGPVDQLIGLPLTLVTMWILFALIFRYVPAKPTPWATVLAGATIAAVTFALMRLGFGLYITRFATFASAFGSFATLLVLYLFLYYSAVLFVLSGEAAYLTTHPEGRSPGERILAPDVGVLLEDEIESQLKDASPEPVPGAGPGGGSSV